jgi:hypothetical protein
MSGEFRDYYRGKTEEVLFEEAVELEGKKMYVGYSREYVKVVAESDLPLDNVMRKGRITEPVTEEIYRIQL